MQPIELFDYIEANNNIAICEAEVKGAKGVALRDDTLPFFQGHQEACEFISLKDLHRMSLDYFKDNLFHGLHVEGITRVTGYFAKVSSWNKGKLGELKDRDRNQAWFQDNKLTGIEVG